MISGTGQQPYETPEHQRIILPETKEDWKLRAKMLEKQLGAKLAETRNLRFENADLTKDRDAALRAQAQTSSELAAVRNKLAEVAEARHRIGTEHDEAVAELGRTLDDLQRAKNIAADAQSDYHELHGRYTELLEMFKAAQDELDGLKLAERRRTKILPPDPFEGL